MTHRHGWRLSTGRDKTWTAAINYRVSLQAPPARASLFAAALNQLEWPDTAARWVGHPTRQFPLKNYQ